MLESLIAQIEDLMRTARDVYGVDPVVFLVIYFCCVPVFYFSLYRMARATAARRASEVMAWSAVFLGANVAPFVYVMLFGRNIPWWVYVLIAVLVGQAVFSLIAKLRKRAA